MCNFCEDIITNEKYDSLSFEDKYNLPIAFIIKDNILDRYHLWIECEDYYYSGKYLKNIKYCPICGREIK